jgi:hypothetical protein
MLDKLIGIVKKSFGEIADHRYQNTQITVCDYLQSSFAMFSLKDPSMYRYRLNYEERSWNLERIYGIKKLPTESTLREAIDEIAPSKLQKTFKPFMEVLEQEGIMKEYLVLGKYQSIAFDGTENYCSCDSACEHCLTKVHKNKKGEITQTSYHHQALSGVMVHYGHKEVFPIACEAIVRQDGDTKNDCELNAGKRLLPLIRQMLPEAEGGNKGYKLLGIFDGLYPNGPFIKALQAIKMRFIIGIKEGYVLVQVEKLKKEGALSVHQWINGKGHTCIAKWYNKLILNGSNQDITVNYFEYEELDKNGKRLFFGTWITDITISKQNIEELVNVGRSRWKIENETFNTLKNQGYHLEHSYGHGQKFLATNFMLLTFLAFLTDQIVQKLDTAFNRAWKTCVTKKKLWEKIRQIFDLIPCMSMNVIFRFIAKEIAIDFPLLI